MGRIVTIEKLDVGFVVRDNDTLPSEHAVQTEQQALQRALFCLTGKSNHFFGNLYAKVVIRWTRPERPRGKRDE